MRLKHGTSMAYHVYGSLWDMFFDDGWKNWTRAYVKEGSVIVTQGQFRPRSQMQPLVDMITAETQKSVIQPQSI